MSFRKVLFFGAALAHKFYVERGGQHGSDAEDWLRAEKVLLGK